MVSNMQTSGGSTNGSNMGTSSATGSGTSGAANGAMEGVLISLVPWAMRERVSCMEEWLVVEPPRR